MAWWLQAGPRRGSAGRSRPILGRPTPQGAGKAGAQQTPWGAAEPLNGGEHHATEQGARSGVPVFAFFLGELLSAWRGARSGAPVSFW
ncbi:hypothetical protein AAU61_10170 [Desulfocarbo indianensis]|nr:hypothetical protein AAU61_10170 [Desulfocarbo indianensis]